MLEDDLLVKEIIVPIIITVFGGLAGFVVWLRKRDIQRLDEMTEKVGRIESTYATDNRVREIVREEVQDLKQEVKSINTTLQHIASTLSAVRDVQQEEKGYRKAIEAMNKKGQ